MGANAVFYAVQRVALGARCAILPHSSGLGSMSSRSRRASGDPKGTSASAERRARYAADRWAGVLGTLNVCVLGPAYDVRFPRLALAPLERSSGVKTCPRGTVSSRDTNIVDFINDLERIAAMTAEARAARASALMAGFMGDSLGDAADALGDTEGLLS